MGEREILLEADPAAFLLTDHYRGYPWVLVRLRAARHAAVMELLERAWERAAPKRLLPGRRIPRAPAGNRPRDDDREPPSG